MVPLNKIRSSEPELTWEQEACCGQHRERSVHSPHLCTRPSGIRTSSQNLPQEGTGAAAGACGFCLRIMAILSLCRVLSHLNHGVSSSCFQTA